MSTPFSKNFFRKRDPWQWAPGHFSDPLPANKKLGVYAPRFFKVFSSVKVALVYLT